MKRRSFLQVLLGLSAAPVLEIAPTEARALRIFRQPIIDDVGLKKFLAPPTRGAISSVTVTSAGSGYTVAPSVTFSSGTQLFMGYDGSFKNA